MIKLISIYLGTDVEEFDVGTGPNHIDPKLHPGVDDGFFVTDSNGQPSPPTHPDYHPYPGAMFPASPFDVSTFFFSHKQLLFKDSKINYIKFPANI